MDFKYQLKKYKTGSDRENCPSCGAKRQFARYVDIETGELLPEKYGWCNKRDSCGYHLNPVKDGYQTEHEGSATPVMAKPRKPNVVVNLPKELLDSSLYESNSNTLWLYLTKLFPASLVGELFKMYLVGNHSVWPGAVIFWFLNKDGAIRAGQVKQFDTTGHTVKVPDREGKIRPRTIWIHNLIDEATPWLQGYKEQDLRQDCLFGEHLLSSDTSKPVALFESPKTAIMAAAYFPNFICLAFGSLDNFTYERAVVLRGRKVILYPDLSKTGSAFNKWVEKAERFKSITEFKVSSILEDNAIDEERAKGLDMGDFLERFNYENMELRRLPEIDHQPAQRSENSPLALLIPKEAMLPVLIPQQASSHEFREPLNERQQFETLLRDLDNGGTWELMIKWDDWKSFETPENLSKQFSRLSSKFLFGIPETGKRAFVHERYKAGFTQAGIIHTFPVLGFKKEWDLNNF